MNKPNEKFKILQDAVWELYVAGKWTCSDIGEHTQQVLWENIRDAAEIPEGTATERRVGQ